MHIDATEEFTALMEAAKRVSQDMGETVQEILLTGIKEPLPPDEIRSVLSKVVEAVRNGTIARGNAAGDSALEQDVESFINQVLSIRTEMVPPEDKPNEGLVILALQEHNGIPVRPVKPSPVFHEREVPVSEGFIRTQDIKIWDGNERIDIHLNQFWQLNNRAPNSEEMLDIMLSKMGLQGTGTKDQFKISDLAKSIAVNGVRVQPIIDVDGTLLDGNRRVSACYHILKSPDFSPEEKKRAEWLQVWQLTEHATEADRNAVIVSLNFETDNKEDWPEYVKAHKVYDLWQSMIVLEPAGDPLPSKITQIKRNIARRFALSTNEVSRYILMVELAQQFEDYHVGERSKDEYAVKHKANTYFQYFDELGKGRNAGGVYWTLNQDESFRNLVFDLLFDGKFRNWAKIRDLKHVYTHEDALDQLQRARQQTDTDIARETVDDACGMARAARPEQRQLGANTKVKNFVDWFEGLPVKAFRAGETGAITRENLERLHATLMLVEQHLNGVVDTAGSAE